MYFFLCVLHAFIVFIGTSSGETPPPAFTKYIHLEGTGDSCQSGLVGRERPTRGPGRWEKGMQPDLRKNKERAMEQCGSRRSNRKSVCARTLPRAARAMEWQLAAGCDRRRRREGL